MLNSWKAVWVVLSEDALEFYKKKTDRSPKGMIPLKGSTLITPCQEFGKRPVRKSFAPPSHLTPGQNRCACGMTNKEKLPLSWFSRSQRKRSRSTSSSRRTWRRGSTGSKTYAGPSHASRVGRSSPGSPPDAPSASRIKST